MSTMLIHQYLVCPSALTSGRLTHLFGAEKGRFLGIYPHKKYKLTKDWCDKDLDQNEIRNLKEIIIRLNNQGALRTIKYEEANPKDTTKNLIIKLLKNSGDVNLGIVANDNLFKGSISKIISIDKFENEGRFTLEPIQLEQTPSAFFNHIPDFIIQSAKTFTLIDPYIFHFAPPKHTPKSRLEFLTQLISKYFEKESNLNNEVTINIFGKRLLNFEKDVIKGHLASHEQLNDSLEQNLNLTVNFFVINGKKSLEMVPEGFRNILKKKVHERFFCADSFCFSFEDSSQDRKHLDIVQTWRFESSKEIKKFIDCYKDNSPIFEFETKYSSRQILQLAKKRSKSSENYLRKSV
ncbi:hypothetical protein N9D70_02305 [bacterium]|nr:hypothetical protein [bacterium]